MDIEEKIERLIFIEAAECAEEMYLMVRAIDNGEYNEKAHAIIERYEQVRARVEKYFNGGEHE